MWLLKTLTRWFQLFGEGRSPAAILNLFAPRDGYALHRDIAYGNGKRHRFDLYVPLVFAAPAPVVLFFYGGAFQAGWKDEYRVVGQALASQGIVVAIADYRIHPEARFPDFLDDGARAFAALHKLAAHYGGDPARIFLAGHSAGAYIAVMLAANPAFLRAANVDAGALRGVIGIAGPYDFLPIVDPVLIEIFGGSSRPETQPINFIDGPRPPMFLATGDADSRVRVLNTRNLAVRLRAAGSHVEEMIYPKAGHMGIILALTPLFHRIAPLRDDIVRFVKTH